MISLKIGTQTYFVHVYAKIVPFFFPVTFRGIRSLWSHDNHAIELHRKVDIQPNATWLRLIDFFCNRIANGLDHNIYNGSTPNVNVPIESQYTTSYAIAIAILVISVTVYEIFTVKIYMTSFDL